jgi:hypothetical protein
MELLARLAVCSEQLKVAAEQLRRPRDDNDASRTGQETIDFLMEWIKSFQVTDSTFTVYDRASRRDRSEWWRRSCVADTRPTPCDSPRAPTRMPGLPPDRSGRSPDQKFRTS